MELGSHHPAVIFLLFRTVRRTAAGSGRFATCGSAGGEPDSRRGEMSSRCVVGRGAIRALELRDDRCQLADSQVLAVF